ncbi:MAG: hypothetical protein RLZZ624_440 [Cyanobacteriota bacterium]
MDGRHIKALRIAVPALSGTTPVRDRRWAERPEEGGSRPSAPPAARPASAATRMAAKAGALTAPGAATNTRPPGTASAQKPQQRGPRQPTRPALAGDAPAQERRSTTTEQLLPGGAVIGWRGRGRLRTQGGSAMTRNHERSQQGRGNSTARNRRRPRHGGEATAARGWSGGLGLQRLAGAGARHRKKRRHQKHTRI